MRLPRITIVTFDYDKQLDELHLFKTQTSFSSYTPTSKTTKSASNPINETKKAGVNHTAKQSVMDTDFNVDMESMHLNCQAEKMIEEYGIPYTFPHPNEFM